MASLTVAIDQEISMDQRGGREAIVSLQALRYQVVCHSQANTWKDGRCVLKAISRGS